jgi:hypothetical protein
VRWARTRPRSASAPQPRFWGNPTILSVVIALVRDPRGQALTAGVIQEPQRKEGIRPRGSQNRTGRERAIQKEIDRIDAKAGTSKDEPIGFLCL